MTRFLCSRSALGWLLTAVAFSTILDDSAKAQGTPNPEELAASTPTKLEKLGDLTTNYRFTERYTFEDASAGPGVICSSKIGIFETVKDSVDTSQGAPKQTESSRQMIYSERPAEMSGLGNVAAMSRTFEMFQAKPDDASVTIGGQPFAGLSVMIRPKQGVLPTIVSLTDGRLLSEYEYEVAARQVFVAQLSSVLPSKGIRIGETWRISRKAAQALLGDPYIQEETLVGKLAEVRKEVDGPRMVASIEVSGQVKGPSGDSKVRAEILFTFQTDPAPKPASTKSSFPPRPIEDATESRGAITELRLGKVTSGPLPGPGRLRFTSRREVTMHRQIGLAAGSVAPPKLLKAPESTESNSWLIHVDAAGRFAFRHPQDFLLPDKTQPAAKPNTTLLIRTREAGTDFLQVEFAAKTLTPEDLKKDLGMMWSAMKMDTTKGAEEWLPEVDWPRMRVHRVEAALKTADPKARPIPGARGIHFDGYLVQFGQSASILAIATTSRQEVGPIRQEFEKILKTIQLDPPRAAVK